MDFGAEPYQLAVYIQVYSAANGVSDELSFYTLAILNGASCLGRIVPNLVADYVGPMNIFGGSCGIAGVLIFTMSVLREIESRQALLTSLITQVRGDRDYRHRRCNCVV